MLIDHESGFAEYVRQGVFIDLLKEAEPKPVGDREGAADGKARQPVVPVPII